MQNQGNAALKPLKDINYPKLADFFPDQDPDQISYDERLRLEAERLRNSPDVVEKIIQVVIGCKKQHVLQIGIGTGYLTAVLASIFEKVTVLESNPDVAAQAKEKLQEIGYSNIEIDVTDGTQGCFDKGPFDSIVVSSRLVRLPEHLLDQLQSQGSIVCSVGQYRSSQTLWALHKSEKGVEHQQLGVVHFQTDIGEILVEIGVMDTKRLHLLRSEAAENKAELVGFIKRKKAVSESDLLRAIALQRGLRSASYVELLNELDPDVLAHLSEQYLRRKRLVPLKFASASLDLATVDPDVDVQELAHTLGIHTVNLCLVTETTYQRLWSTIVMQLHSHNSEPIGSHSSTDDGLDSEDSVETTISRTGHAELSRAEQILDSILLEAVAERASDIHFEHFGSYVRVRLRVDGELRVLEKQSLSAVDLDSLINVMKVQSQLDVTEHRKPQSGSFRRQLASHSLELRIQTQLTNRGENAVLRILEQQARVLDINELGLSKTIAENYRRLLNNPGGLILITGPTGSGKSTTLYSAILELASDHTRKVISVEDPIECVFDGIQQTAINPNIGFTFDKAVRNFMRQDPDVIVIGEIRDEETAREAIRASQTGHLVIATLHSNDTTDTVQRLLDLGVHPNSLSSELLAVMSQRLAKCICPSCRVEVEPDAQLIEEIQPDGYDLSRVYKGVGCDRCYSYGNYGRIVVAEFMYSGIAVRNAISRGSTTDELRAAAHQNGLITMRDSFLRLVESGQVSLSEIQNVLPEERMHPEQPNSGNLQKAS